MLAMVDRQKEATDVTDRAEQNVEHVLGRELRVGLELTRLTTMSRWQ